MENLGILFKSSISSGNLAAIDLLDPENPKKLTYDEFDIRGSNSWEPEDLTALLDLIAAGKMEVPIANTFPLTETKEALRLIEDREVIGKVIVAP